MQHTKAQSQKCVERPTYYLEIKLRANCRNHIIWRTGLWLIGNPQESLKQSYSV